MNAIKVNKAQLVETLKGNLEKHKAIFQEAQDGYREKYIAELEDMLADAKAGKKIRRMVTLVEPMVDQSKDYSRVIQMLGMSVDEEVMLEEYDFQQYVLDEWQWKERFTASNSMYLKSA